MATVETSGTTTTTATTEVTLATITTAKTFVLNVDVSVLATGEDITIRGKKKVLSGGTTRLMTEFEIIISWFQAVGGLTVELPPITSTQECVFTIQPSTASSRAWPWSVEVP